MRITKKFSRTRLIGKSSYKRAGEATPDEIATLEGARRAFRRHAELPDESFHLAGDAGGVIVLRR